MLVGACLSYFLGPLSALLGLVVGIALMGYGISAYSEERADASFFTSLSSIRANAKTNPSPFEDFPIHITSSISRKIDPVSGVNWEQRERSQTGPPLQYDPIAAILRHKQELALAALKNKPHITVEIKDVQIRADHCTAFTEGDQLCCSCDVFVHVYLVNTAGASTTVKDAELLILSPSGKEYCGELVSMEDGYELGPDEESKQRKSAMVYLLSPKDSLKDLRSEFNSQEFSISHGRLGWLRFCIKEAIVAKLPEATFTLTIVDALGGRHIGKIVGTEQEKIGTVTPKIKFY